jgi:putative transcriptional regulator
MSPVPHRVDRPRLSTTLTVAAACAIGLAVSAPSQRSAHLPPAELQERGPRPGDFLIASRRLGDANFAESVVLLLHTGADGAQGIIVNRRTLVRIATALPEIKALADRPDTLYWGGPVEPQAAVLLVRDRKPPPDATLVVEGVWMVRSRESIEDLLRRGAPDTKRRLYGGYAGWATGQLEWELSTRNWHLLRADADLIFSDDTDGLWKALEQLASAPVV